MENASSVSIMHHAGQRVVAFGLPSEAHKITDDNAKERLGKKMKRRRGFSRKTQGQDKWEDKGRDTHKM